MAYAILYKHLELVTYFIKAGVNIENRVTGVELHFLMIKNKFNWLNIIVWVNGFSLCCQQGIRASG